MILRIALRSFAAQPIRSVVLACGFGAGIACMAGLLGVGEVILEQSRSPHLRGGGDLVVYGASGDLTSARFLTSRLFSAPPFDGRARVASPSRDATLYLFETDGEPLAVAVRGGVPSLERALGDPEVSAIEAWRDAPGDLAWSDPSPEEVLRAMDRFHAIPDAPARAASWAEWLYFNGHTDRSRFYLTFLVGPRVAPHRRRAGVRLQLERDGVVASYLAEEEIDEAGLLAMAPDLDIGGNSVRLEGTQYRIRLALGRSHGGRAGAEPDVTGEITLDASGAGSLPPFEVRGARQWVSGYTVPVLSGELGGRLVVEGRSVPLADGRGYHDHNWGFWEGVTWQWGQVASDELSLLYGKIRPPADAADPDRVPGFLVALGDAGPLGFSTDVTIEEHDDPAGGRPARISVRGRGVSLELEMELTVQGIESNPLGRTFGGEEAQVEFLQMRASYRVAGELGGQPVDFTADGAAETFRGPASRR